MSSALDALIPQLANYNPQGFALKNQQLQGQIGLNAAQTAAEQARVPYIQQQTAGLAQEQAIKQQSLQDAQIVRQAYMNTDGKPENITPYLIKNGISGTGLMGWQQHAYDLLSKAQTYTKQQAEAEDRLHNLAGNVVDSLNGIKDDAEMQQSYQEQLPTLQREAPDVQWKPQITRDDLKFYSGVLGHAKAALEQGRIAAETAGIGATQKKTEAETAGEQQKTELTRREIQLHDNLINNPGGLERYVAGSIDPNQFPQEYKAAVNEARMTANIKDLDAVVSRHSENVSHQVSQKSLETDPDIMAVRRKQSEAQAGYENALRQGDEANKEYYGSLASYNQTLGLSKTIDKIVELARSGNPIPAKQLEDAIIPQFTNAMEGIKARGGYGNDKGFTSARDTALNMFRSAVNGKPLDASSLDQIMPYVKTITNGAAETHNQNVRSIKQGYGQSHPEEPKPYKDIANAGTVAPKAGAPNKGATQTYQGRKYIFDGANWVGQ